MGKNLEKLQKITGNTPSALHVEQDNNNSTPHDVEKDPGNLVEIEASTPMKAEVPPHSHFPFFS